MNIYVAHRKEWEGKLSFCKVRCTQHYSGAFDKDWKSCKASTHLFLCFCIFIFISKILPDVFQAMRLNRADCLLFSWNWPPRGSKRDQEREISKWKDKNMTLMKVMQRILQYQEKRKATNSSRKAFLGRKDLNWDVTAEQSQLCDGEASGAAGGAVATPRTGFPPDSKYHWSHQQGLGKIQWHNSIPLVWVSWAKRNAATGRQLRVRNVALVAAPLGTSSGFARGCAGRKREPDLVVRRGVGKLTQVRGGGPEWERRWAGSGSLGSGGWREGGPRVLRTQH